VKYHATDYVATHSEPLRRKESNFIVRAYLGSDGGENRWEQLWVQKTPNPGQYILCCIPFFVYNLSLGDEVSTDEDLTVRTIIRHSGHKTFRLWFKVPTEHFMRERLMLEIRKHGAFMEWSSNNLLALSAENETAAQSLANLLAHSDYSEVAEYETGNM
jgi:hypothetical protein